MLKRTHELRSPLGQWHVHLVDDVMSWLMRQAFNTWPGADVVYFVAGGLLLDGLVRGSYEYRA